MIDADLATIDAQDSLALGAISRNAECQELHVNEARQHATFHQKAENMVPVKSARLSIHVALRHVDHEDVQVGIATMICATRQLVERIGDKIPFFNRALELDISGLQRHILR